MRISDWSSDVCSSDLGFEARVVSRPGPFLRELDIWAPTHIALDLVMPEMDGVEVVRLLAGRQCRAAVIITSGGGGRVSDAARRSAVEHGLDVVGVLAKPFFPDAVRKLLHTSPAGSMAEEDLSARAQDVRFEVTEAVLQQAVQERQFQLVYQPKVACATGALAGFEALVRWHHPTRGTVMPDEFIPLAEATGLIDAITGQVLDRGLRWLASDPASAGLSLSVNRSEEHTSELQSLMRISYAV